MATELYGVDAVVGASTLGTPVSTSANLVFYGTSSAGAVGVPQLIAGWADAVEKLGCASGDGYTLTDAAIAAFKVCNLKQIYCIPVSNSIAATASDYTEVLENISDLWMKYGIIANMLCAPRVQDADVVSALVTAAKKQNGHFDGIVVYDGVQEDAQLNAEGRPVLSELTSAKVKTSTDKICICQWGYAKLKSGDVISGAALRACRLALADMQNPGSLPSRCSGNLDVDIEASVLDFGNLSYPLQSGGNKGSTSFSPKELVTTDNQTIAWDDNATYRLTGDVPDTITGIVKMNGNVAITWNGLINWDDGAVQLRTIYAPMIINAKESDLTQLSADGIDSFLNIGGGQYVTWGDHTAAFINGTIVDETGRFDNYMRMMFHVTNRFQQKYRNIIDNRLTLKVRNDILSEENDYLNLLVSQEALIGSPKCKFDELENSTDTAQKGEFYFEDFMTITPPAKYIKLKTTFTADGFVVYEEV